MAASQSSENPDPSRLNATGIDSKKAVIVTRPYMLGGVRLIPVDLADCKADFDETTLKAKNKLITMADPNASQLK